MNTQPFTRSGARVTLELPDTAQGDLGTCSSRGRGSELEGYVCPFETSTTFYDIGYIGSYETSK